MKMYPSCLSPTERHLIVQHPSKSTAKQVQSCSWKNEEIWFLLHLLQVLDSPEPVIPRGQCNYDAIFDSDALVDCDSAEEFITLARSMFPDRAARVGHLRTTLSMLDNSDMFYRFHWFVRDQCIQLAGAGQEPPGGLLDLCDVVMAWRRAVDWVLFLYEWDAVPMDT
eukprot:GILK01013991.1.p1 GENE.GILK01013991.1~~GILK01013991.1.p1  ORF type:complete len:167 (+),score=13.91 GILK01013991.1:431-931(+)